ncbi:DUF4255 domain-containing protein [Streptomyces rimosus]|uniref:DUF4255 domain-containing protein n=1 Tax=Streptomyces rimosus TaxID=1927 RepID=UPI00099C4D11
MIHEVDEVLKGLIGGGALAGSGIEVSFEVPTRDWAARRNAPVINAYLYDVREDVSQRQRGRTALRDDRDTVVRHRRPPRWFRLSYLVTAWTKTPQDGHRLPSAVPATLLPHELIAAHELPETLGRLGLAVPVTVGGSRPEARSTADISSALGDERSSSAWCTSPTASTPPATTAPSGPRSSRTRSGSRARTPATGRSRPSTSSATRGGARGCRRRARASGSRCGSPARRGCST